MRKTMRIALLCGAATMVAIAAPSTMQAQDMTAAETNDDGGDDKDYGWIGLLGLAGLAGLRKRDRADHVDTTRRV